MALRGHSSDRKSQRFEKRLMKWMQGQ